MTTEDVLTSTATRSECDSLDTIDLFSRAPIGWNVTFICALIALLETMATGAVAGALSQIQETFDLSDTQAGFIPTAAIVGALIAAPASAVLANRGNRALVLAGGAVLWALVAGSSALAPIFALFLLSRMLLGAAGQLNNPAASSMIADAHPAHGRAKAFGLERMANYLGLPVGIALGGALASSIGWRKGFALLMIPALLFAVLAAKMRTPPRGLGDRIDQARALAEYGTDHGTDVGTDHGTDHGTQDGSRATATPSDQSSGVAALREQFRAVVAIRSLRSVLIGVPLLFFALAAVFFWSTRFFEDTQGLTEDDAAAIAGAVGGTSIVIGILLGARFGDKFHGKKPGWRLQLCSAGVLVGLVGFTTMLAGTSIKPLSIAGFGLANIGMAIAIPNQTAAVADVVPAHQRGTAFSVLQFLLALGGAFGPPAVGAASDALGSLRPAMAIVLIALVGSAFILRKGATFFDADVARVVSPMHAY